LSDAVEFDQNFLQGRWLSAAGIMRRMRSVRRVLCDNGSGSRLGHNEAHEIGACRHDLIRDQAKRSRCGCLFGALRLRGFCQSRVCYHGGRSS
jgi:hypothetical protein